ncbi:hypothetical protein ABEW81_11055 [Priestia megaterium]
MSDFSTRINVKSTRKDHKCLGCLNVIPKGSEAINNKGHYEDFYNYYLCTPCDEFLSKNSRHEIIEEGLFDGCVNEIKDYEGGSSQ